MKPMGVELGKAEGHGGGMVECVHVMGIMGKVS